MKKNTLFFTLFAVVFTANLFAVQDTRAQDQFRTTKALDQLFTIRDVKIDESARSSLVAREKGLEKSQRYAWQALIRKIVAIKDFDRVPDLTLPQIMAMIRGIDYKQESRSGRRYIAVINIGFEPAKVTKFLSDHDIPHVLGAGTGVLLVHVHSRNGLNYMWEESHAGRQAWAQVDSVNRLRTYATLEESLDIRAKLGRVAVMNAAKGQNTDMAALLQGMAKKRGMDEAVIIHTDYDAQAKKVDYHYLLTATGLKGQGVITAQDAPPLNQQDHAVALSRKAIDTVLDKVDDSWRSQLLVNSALIGDVTLFLPTNSLEDFQAIQTAVAGLSLIQSWTIEELSVPVSKAKLVYRGRLDQLTLALNLAGYTVEKYGEGWLLQPIK